MNSFRYRKYFICIFLLLLKLTIINGFNHGFNRNVQLFKQMNNNNVHDSLTRKRLQTIMSGAKSGGPIPGVGDDGCALPRFEGCSLFKSVG